ncbi:MAG: hypothetical protein IPL84_18450 [Chitinophagaceae bacterium]|nr:hypothetical protein [Chitinophagaceae bacterium]
MRKIIYSYLNKSKEEIEESDEFLNYPKLILLTSYHKGDHTSNFINPNTSPSNPELFFIGPYNALISHSTIIPPNFELKTGLAATIIDNELTLNLSPESIIGVINESAWLKVIKTLAKREAQKFMHTMTFDLVNKTRLPYAYCRYRLEALAYQLNKSYPDDYIKCLRMAYQTLMA